MENSRFDVPVRRYFTLLSQYLRPYGSTVVLTVVLLLLGIALQILSPHVLRLFIDAATQGSGSGSLARLALFFTVTVLMRQVCLALGTYFSESIGWAATNKLRSDLFHLCLSLEPTFHKQRTPGEMIERIDGDVTTLTGFFSHLVAGVFANALLLVCLLSVLLVTDIFIGLYLLAFAAITLVVLWRMRNESVPRWRAFRQQSALFFGELGEWLYATEEIKANGAAPYVMSRLHRILRQWYPLLLHAGRVRFAMMSGSLFLFSCGIAVSLAASAHLYLRGAMTLGTVYMVFSYAELVWVPLESLRTQIQELQRATGSISRVEELLSLRPASPKESEATLSLDRPIISPPSLRFEGVTFGYETADSVLKNVTFEVPSGGVIGVLGRTGSGKSTIARLILKLYEPSSGSILVGDQPLASLQETAIRRGIGMITQEVHLFNASVRDNLTLFSEGIADTTLISALHAVGLSDFILGLPDGLDTNIGPGSTALSAGEAQLLSFARLLLRDPGLVVLDEASSRLDPITERRLEQAMENLFKNRTGVIIAHRLSTISKAQYILVLENGRVVEFGDRQDLSRDPGSHLSRILKAGVQEVLA